LWALVFDARGEQEAARADYDAFLERHGDKDNASAQHARERIAALGG
jgi:hypothetical protein